MIDRYSYIVYMLPVAMEKDLCKYWNMNDAMYTDITYLEKREREDNRSNSDKIKTKDVILKAVPRSVRLCSNSTSLVRPYSTRCK